MRLFIAEKPDMGRKIASFLPGPHVKKPGYIETGGGLVTWCVGHLLEQSQPGAYGEKYEKFPGVFDDLPIVPTQWKLEPIESKRRQISAIRDLLKQCTEVIHAGDPGREGQLIVDEVLDFCNNRKPVQRLSLNALDKTSVMRALASLQPNTQFHSLYQAALGRQRADWMVGMNMSRAFTILGSRQGYRGVLSIGRVQTPTLAIVVRRDAEIDAFVPKDYWSVHALFKAIGGEFWTTWLPPGNSLEDGVETDDDEEDESEDDVGPGAAGATGTAIASWQDESRRVIVKTVAEKVAQDARAAGFGVVSKAEKKPVIEQAPVLFELTSLQSEVHALTSASLKEVLDACQKLYENGHVSYPRTDCAYLPESQHADAGGILAVIAGALPQLAPFMAKADPTRKSRVFDDKKMEKQEHHAIVPTASPPDVASLPPLEASVYTVVAKRYLAQFLPLCEVDKSLIEVECAGHLFAARGRIVRIAGWRELFASAKAVVTGKVEATLPSVDVGQRLDLGQAKVEEHRTSPPARYTQGTLVKAMKHVYLLVKDPVERKKLKAVEGIGRSATRAAILENLLKRGFLLSEKNKLSSSSVAKILVGAAPAALTDPGLTARWETALDAVATGAVALPLFEQKQVQWIQSLLVAAAATQLPPPPPEAAWPAGGGSGSGGGKKFPAKKSGKPSARSGPPRPVDPNAVPCPKCKQGAMLPRQVKAGAHAGKSFMGCSNYPACKHSEWPK
jgi:DNA topoisomerase-3